MKSQGPIPRMFRGGEVGGGGGGGGGGRVAWRGELD